MATEHLWAHCVVMWYSFHSSLLLGAQTPIQEVELKRSHWVGWGTRACHKRQQGWGGHTRTKSPFFPFIEKSGQGTLGTTEGLEAYFVNKRKRESSLKFCSKMNMFTLEALWPLGLSKITLEVLLLFLTGLNLSLLMKCQNTMAEKSNDCNFASGFWAPLRESLLLSKAEGREKHS